MGLITSLGRIFASGHEPQPGAYRGERASRRYDSVIRASFTGSSFSRERAGNVGIGGFCFEHERELVVGSRVRLLIELAGTGHWIRVTGEVLGHTPRGRRIGVRGRFIRIHIDDERQLARWLDQRTQAHQAA